MSYRKYLIFLSAAAVLGWLAFGLVLFELEPCTEAGQITVCKSVAGIPLFLFFFSLFIALVASCTLLGLLMRYWLHHEEPDLDELRVSFRQSLLLSASAIGALGLLLLESLTWWSGLLLIAIAIFIESYCVRAAS